MSPRVLLVEDDDTIARPLVRTLQREGYDVERVTQGLAAIEVLGSAPPHLVVLDLGLPDVDGLEVCRRAREGGYDGGIMILTARGGELDRVVGLDIGADDYLAKPFPLSEMLARVRALLRRGGMSGGDVEAGAPSTARPTQEPVSTPQRAETAPERAELEEHQVPARIDTVRGVGFRLERDIPDA